MTTATMERRPAEPETSEEHDDGEPLHSILTGWFRQDETTPYSMTLAVFTTHLAKVASLIQPHVVAEQTQTDHRTGQPYARIFCLRPVRSVGRELTHLIPALNLMDMVTAEKPAFSRPSTPLTYNWLNFGADE
jgi:hypothetical protein